MVGADRINMITYVFKLIYVLQGAYLRRDDRRGYQSGKAHTLGSSALC